MASVKLEARLTGDRKLRRNLRKLSKKYPEAFAAALYKGGFFIMEDSVPRVPVHHGTLKGSAFVSPPKNTSRGTVVVLGYGTDYAIYVHERTELRHTNGEAKFLERAIQAKGPDLGSNLARWTREFVEAGGVDGAVQLPPADFPPKPRNPDGTFKKGS